MTISASDVKKLRELTGAGMMACKEALGQSGGDLEKSIDYLRKKGLAQAQKRQGRLAAEGTVATVVEQNCGVLLEVNSETDFVAGGSDFKHFVETVATSILKDPPTDLQALKARHQQDISELTMKCGEKIDIRRFVSIKGQGPVGAYNHGGKIGVLVELAGPGDSSQVGQVIKDLAMHVAASDPKFLRADQIDDEFKKREAEIYSSQLRDQGRPEEMIPKIIQGKLAKLASEVCLLNQKFVKDPNLTVAQFLAGQAKELGCTLEVSDFHKFTLGEGLEKK